MAFTIHIIAPYPAMVPIIEECLSEFQDINIDYSVGDLENGVQIAKREEQQGTDIIISRGGTAQLIKEHVNIPVIDMHLSGYDLLRSLTLASNIQDKTAVVGFSNITSGAASIIDVLDLPLNVYTVNDAKEVAPLLLKLKESGYQQILGDVITTSTSEIYGLKGMLLQSGKESIMKSIEDAASLYNHLSSKNKVIHTLKQFIAKDHSNILIVNEQLEVIDEHYNDFPSNPLSEEQLYILNTNLAANQHIHQVVEQENQQIAVTGYQYHVENQTYHLYLLSKNKIHLKPEKGIHLHQSVSRETLALQSDAMAATVEVLTSLYKHNESVYLYGEKGTGKQFIVEQIHSQLAEGSLVTVDGSEADNQTLHRLIAPSIGTIILTDPQELLVVPSFPAFLKNCEEQKIRIFVLAEAAGDLERLEELDMNLVNMPALRDRKEDIHELALYFLAEFHQRYGTKAIRITEAARQAIEDHHYKNNVESLKACIKQLALHEQDYILHKETVENVLLNMPQEEAALPLIGTLKEIETEIVKRVLMEEDNNQTKAAKRLGINRSTLWRKLKG